MSEYITSIRQQGPKHCPTLLRSRYSCTPPFDPIISKRVGVGVNSGLGVGKENEGCGDLVRSCQVQGRGGRGSERREEEEEEEEERTEGGRLMEDRRKIETNGAIAFVARRQPENVMEWAMWCEDQIHRVLGPMSRLGRQQTSWDEFLLFRNLSTEEVNDCISRMKVRTFKPGEQILKQGSIGTTVVS
eukprot:756730-Hanusia_phi.AAC.1